MAGIGNHMRLTAAVAMTALVVGGLQMPAGARPTSKVKISITDVTITEGNAGTHKAVFTVHAGGKRFRESSVSFSTSTGSATAGDDFVDSQGSVSFLGARDQTVAITINGDIIDVGA